MKRIHLIALSILSGVLLSLPWLNVLPGWVLFFAFTPLFIAEDYLFSNSSRFGGTTFFWYANLAFAVWNGLTCWWIIHATFFGAFMVIILNACFMATIWWLFHQFKRNYKPGIAYLALFAVWLAYEYVHFHWDIEWPWLNLGNGFANNVKLVQWYEYTGMLGGSLWVLIVNLLIYEIIKRFREHRQVNLVRVAVLFVVIGFPIIFSYNIYSSYSEKGDSVEVVVLQPNIDPYTEKFGSISPEDQLKIMLELADSLVTGSTDFVVAPETAIHPIWEGDQMSLNPFLLPFKKLVDEYPSLKIVSGATTYKKYGSKDKLPITVRYKKEQGVYYDVFNSALLIDSTEIVQVYHKSILVTGVEKMPFYKYVSFLDNFILDLGGTTGSLGYDPEPIVFNKADEFSVAPVICYESVFGGYISRHIQKGANLIFIITNDGWWRDTPGYRQHLSFARLRAIETRRSIARSANTGISALINERGDIIQKTNWWERTAINGKISANNKLTFYTIYGDFVGRICSFIAVLLVLFFIVQRKSGS